MERINILNQDNREIISLGSQKSEYFVCNLKEANFPLQIVINENSNVDLLLLEPSELVELTFEVKDNASLHLAILAHNVVKSFKITANVGQNAHFSSHFADFIVSKSKGEVAVNLNKQGATCDWHLASLTEKNEYKEFDVSVYHNSPNTFAQLDNYGVCRDEGKLVFSGICKINNGSHGSKAHQNAKIMVFDEKSDGIAKPILKIDENDIEASHAAVVGKINDEHIFYLTSRGLTEEEAKRLITLGYLKPILQGFVDEDVKETIERLIEGKM